MNSSIEAGKKMMQTPQPVLTLNAEKHSKAMLATIVETILQARDPKQRSCSNHKLTE